jgi:hypothetical protein
MGNQLTRNVVIALAVLGVVLIAYFVLTMPDQRSTSQKISDAAHALDQGPGKAAQQLEDRTPGQRLGDTIKDNTQAH